MTTARRRTLPLGLALTLAVAVPAARADVLVNFDNLGLAANSYENGAHLKGSFTSGGAAFNNSYDSTYDAWSGWAYSNVHDTSLTAPDYSHQYAAVTGGDHTTGRGNYAIASDYNPNDSIINLPSGTAPASLYLTNSTYGYTAMKLGDGFAPKFHSGDFFKVEISGYSGLNASGTSVGEVDAYLANYHSDSDSPLSTWMLVDLSPLAAGGAVKSLGFAVAASANQYGSFGLNTPATFAIDDLRLGAVPEPTAGLLLATGLLGLLAVRRVHPRRA